MAPSSYHTRSNSIPNRPHPVLVELDEQLRRLRSSEATSTSSSSTISHQLIGLQDLHNCVDKWLLLPLTQQSSAQGQQKKWANELLDGSLRLLDMCDTAKDALLQIKECFQGLQSSLRRRCGSDTRLLAGCVRRYLTTMKAVAKSINKALGKLKSVKASFPKLHDSNEMVSVLKDVEAITIMVLESLLSFISSSQKGPTKLSGWSLVSKLAKPKRMAPEENDNTNEFQKIDVALQSIVSVKKEKSDSNKNVEDVQNQLKDLELCIQDLEGDLESLYRRLIKTRVSFLNILTH
ncbi:hypothetical protein HS088_TW22G00808 [Tripterygium wilfordii]|uniref:Uncharacterized protein n=1 Tax=Tripterygium wilfordii TaxID=458696 RepID=A0A7J7BZ30_TRIWF|nr:uncharacterized protein LOC119991431 [Tripterygium wilfordii]KAF5727121.1 hypothetical protein HS088_TW22G00808 [Tripterygium wilfordii]